ncbi:transglutaminase-like domain-containing protein [Acetivibrio cellulolyticus]|uniref:transglutaminase-like domain-containing protein n=1 Tax=Acetivibrio cellulolyticus TaxID=35830 RepID=UPI0001E2E7D2|nr:transglutaminase-like domain-containing protein [Acetivibrio cellulolyticus]
MKKSLRYLLLISIVITICLNSVQAFGDTQTHLIVSNGVVLETLPTSVEGKVVLTGNTYKSKIKIIVSKDDTSTWYDVSLTKGKYKEEIWLIDGKGKYKISVVVHEYDRTYSYGPTLEVENTIDVNRFLVPTKHVESNNEEIIALAKSITQYSTTEKDKALSIYNWVAKNIEYDYDKYLRQINKNFDNDYGAVITLKTKTGVCYDYSTLVAALGRAVGLQVKVIKGNFVNPYRKELHAWNEIYIPEENRWVNVDTTFAHSLNTNYFDNSDFYTDHEKISEY